jgi:hypothetical protein
MAAKKAALPVRGMRTAKNKMAKGGMAGMHKMPDGSMMRNSDMADKMGRAVKRKTADVKGRAMKKGA